MSKWGSGFPTGHKCDHGHVYMYCDQILYEKAILMVQ